MFWRILPHASACQASGKWILLDTRQDRYFLVPSDAEAAFSLWLSTRHSMPAPSAVRDLLVRARVLGAHDEAPTNALVERVAIPGNLSVAEPGSARVDLRLALVVATTWARLRVRPLRTILRSRLARPPLPNSGQLEPTMASASAYEMVRTLIPIARNCLLDSLALDAWLARQGLGCTLVFGVTSNPFTAHCWLQTRECLLNDSFDHVSRFTPILAL